MIVLSYTKATLARSKSTAPYRMMFLVVGCSFLSTDALAWAADLDQKVAFNIEEQPLDEAFLALSKQGRIQVVLNTGAVGAVGSSPIHDSVAVRTALETLLRNTGLQYVDIGQRTVSITSVEGGSVVPRVLTAEVTADAVVASDSEELASSAIGEAINPQVSGSAASNGGRRKDLDEVIVSAQKRSERLQDVPVPVTVIGADALVEGNQLRLEDYYSQVPGLTYTTDFRGAPSLAIRGLATASGFSNPTVGVVVDDVPYGSSTGLGGGSSVPDIDPSDLQRVEVLRGPQGTLYGASTLGGLLKFVTLDPSTDSWFGNVLAGTSGVYHGADAGYNARGSVNAPFSDTFALRASGFTRRDPGYVDNILTRQSGVNRLDADGGRLAAIWRPTDAFSLKIGALYQYSKAQGSNLVELQSNLSDLQQSDVRGSGFADRRAQVYYATATLKLGVAEFSSITGYSINDLVDSSDLTAQYGAVVTEPIFGIQGTTLLDHTRTEKLSQEIRASVPVANHIDWLLGLFYTHEHSPYVQELYAITPDSGAIVGSLGTFNYTTMFNEYAAFTDLTFHITDVFDIQVGGRESQNRQTYSEVDTGPLVGGQVVNPEVATKDNSFTYLVTPRYRILPDLMVYARLASGYRPGGPNSTCIVLGVPCHYGPDKTSNYELGLKGKVPEYPVEFDASFYYINWKNIQLTQVDQANGFTYFSNGSRAKSQGVELSVSSSPVHGLRLGAWASYNDSVLTEDLPPTAAVYGIAGARLPYGARISGSVSIDDELSLTGNLIGFAGGSISLVGDRVGSFNPSLALGVAPPRQNLPAYARTDLRIGLRYQTWTANVFVNNVTDRRGVLIGGLGTSNSNAFSYIQPRTVGLLVSKSF